jgi:hypothetical protein
MYVIRNKISGRYASGVWLGGNRARWWCDLEGAKGYSSRERARGEMEVHTVPGTCDLVELAGGADFPHIDPWHDQTPPARESTVN